MSEFTKVTGRTGMYTILVKRGTHKLRVVRTNRVILEDRHTSKGIWCDHPVKDLHYDLPPGVDRAEDLDCWDDYNEAFRICMNMREQLPHNTKSENIIRRARARKGN